MIVELLVLGLFAGVLTTIAGMGGGLLLIVVLSALKGPHYALAVTTPALLVANLHRAYLFRREVNLTVAKAFALGAIPAALLAGYFVPRLPALVLQMVLIGATLLTLARALGLYTWKPSPRAITTGGAGIGILTATAGGAGVLTGPLFLSAGLKGAAYIGTVAMGAVCLHFGRVLGYGLGGLFDATFMLPMTLLAVALVAGNVAGKGLRKKISTKIESAVEMGALVVCTVVALVGVG
ncbi:MAG: sulfite exporter TauE/SafE family protein [Myxococcales bacterium]|nr:sulfite exporter TauE/SafE family protein [Myxococcales bacterium]